MRSSFNIHHRERVAPIGSHMAESGENKKQIIAALSTTRAELNSLSLLLRRDLDIRRWILESRKKHVRTWMTVAAIFGWILSRLPARKTKIYIQSADPQTPRKKQRSGGLPAALRKSAWLITKPLLVAYLTKKIAEKAKI
jgi:hypothetical protein